LYQRKGKGKIILTDKLELLAPAGSPEKLKTALLYGADAVYMAGENYSLRAFADNFSIQEMKECIDYVHMQGKKAYITVNAFHRDKDTEELKKYLCVLKGIMPDAIIVSDPGIIMLTREIIPEIKIHLSTQANCTSSESANFWYKQGIRRIVLARELSLEEIKVIRDKIPADMELEAFIHGAMCVSYSGRCLLSNFMANRDSNRGMCAQPCRWEFGITEEKHKEDVYTMSEDKNGTYIMNSRDIRMIEHLDKIKKAGISSIKIEGRMKSTYYTAVVTSAYRKVLDCNNKGKQYKKTLEKSINELNTVSHRPYTTGFYLGDETPDTMEIEKGGYIKDYEFIGVVKGFRSESSLLLIEQRNRFFPGDDIEIITPDGMVIDFKLGKIFNDKNESIESANHPKMLVSAPYSGDIPATGSVIRKKLNIS
jgi:putative protease